MNIRTAISSVALIFASTAVSAYAQHRPDTIVGQLTPSYAQYFSWVNNTNEGATEENTMINFDFFQWLKDTYGMQLDIYAFDAGAIDGAKMYGDMSNARFRKHFPNGFAPIARRSEEMGLHLGLWGGPDGFGDTPDEAEDRMSLMKSLVSDYNFRLFKLDAVCGHLRPEKYGYFDRMMTDIRKEAPDFIFLNHRLQLGEGDRHSTTHLLGGAETYIDVHMTNDMTAPHHRGKAIARELPEGLTRMTEDHGVCLSSSLDGWEHDLVLQAFNRNLIMAPQIYANPWLLSDEEFSYLAFIYNLHRDYRHILVTGSRLPEEIYGPDAVTRGDGRTQFITIRNLTWEPVKYSVRMDGSVGLKDKKEVKARLYHPYIYDMGSHKYGSELEVEVEPFGVALLKLTTEPELDNVALSGVPYRIVNDRVGNVAEVVLLGNPGEKYDIRLEKGADRFGSARVDGESVAKLASGKKTSVEFGGKKSDAPWHYKVSEMEECDVPDDISSVYYATCFAADNNALEARSLKRSGPTRFDAVQRARDAFFNQELFKKREIWDRNMFDDDESTAFSISMRWGDPRENGESAFYLDFDEVIELDSLTIESFDEYSISPLKSEEGVLAYVSSDLKNWREITFVAGPRMTIPLSDAGPVRYVRFAPCPMRINEVRGYRGGYGVERDKWHASNLFRPYGGWNCVATQTWKTDFTLDHIDEGAYICVAVNGNHGKEGVWAGFKIDGEYVGCPDRAASFTANPWEYRTANSDRNYTYYFPLTSDMAGKRIEAFVMSLNPNAKFVNTDRPDTGVKAKVEQRELRPEVWVTSHKKPFVGKTLLLQ